MEALDVENQEPHWPCVGKRPLLCNWMFKKKKKGKISFRQAQDFG